MTSNDLLSRTVRYQVREPSPPRASSSEDLTYEPRPTLPRILSSREPHEDRPQSRRIDGTAERTIPPPISDARTYLASPASLPFPLLDLDDDCTPSRRNISSLNHPSFAITTDYNDTSGDEEEESSAATLADRRRRDHLPPSYGSSEDDTEEGVPSRWPTSRPRVLGFPSSQRRSRRRTSPSRIEIEADPAEESSRSNVEGEQLNADVEVLAPHARFFIDQHKSMISIKFEPPV